MLKISPLEARKATRDRLGLVLSIIAFALTATFAPLYVGVTNPSLDVFPLFLFGLNAAICIVAIYRESILRPFSLNNTHLVAILFLLIFAPYAQYVFKSPPVQTDVGHFEPLLVRANEMVSLWLIVYLYSYLFSRTGRPKSGEAVSVSMPVSSKWLAWMSILAAAVVMMALGPGAMFAISRNQDQLDTVAQPLKLIAANFARAIPVLCLTWSLITIRKNRVAVIVLTVIALITNFPPAVARYWTGAMFIGTACILKRRSTYGFWLCVLFFVAAFAALPFLSLFRHRTLDQVDYSSYQKNSFKSVITGGDYDAFSMLVNTIYVVDSGKGPGIGVQAVGNVLFFVPRSIWSEKPMGSGYTVGKSVNLGFLNLSEPLVAEAYVNGGMVMVLLYASLIGALFRRLDDAYWGGNSSFGPFKDWCALVYPFLCGFVFFIVRGDFLSGFAYTAGFALAGVVLVALSYRFKYVKARGLSHVVQDRISESMVMSGLDE